MSVFYTTVARFYDAETGDKIDDLAMYSRLAEQYTGDILDIGCGTGRVLIHLAQEGYTVHGIDNDREMLDRLDHKLEMMPHLQENITYYDGDVLTYEMDRQYSLILLTYNALMHFQDQDTQIQLLQQLRKWLADDGLLVIDLPNAGDVFASQDTESILLERTFLEPESGHMVMLQSVSYLDRVTQVLHVDWIYDEIDGDGTVRRLIAPHQLRYYFEPEIRLLLQVTGFAVDDIHGSTEEDPFEEGAERMIVFAMAR
jgi:SAM-dependent methyltransferase